jgi:hypothetical protein
MLDENCTNKHITTERKAVRMHDTDKNLRPLLRDRPKSRRELLKRHRVWLLVLACMDWRFCLGMRHAIREFYKSWNLDLVSLPGGSYSICRPRTFSPSRWLVWVAHRITVRHALDLAVTKHHVQKIVLANHEHCGMVRSDGFIFDSDQETKEEKEFHFGKLLEARQTVSNWFPGVEVDNIFVYPDKRGLIQIETFQKE